MFKNRFLLFAVLICATVLVVISCKKIPIGYLSSNLFYNTNPLNVPQGTATVSEGLVGDGSTTPLMVKLLGIRNLATGADASKIFLTPDSVVSFTGSPDYTDSTLAALNAKLKTVLAAPFSIGAQGGRLQFTAATTHIPIGLYTIDIQVSNVRGTKTLDNICKINVVRPLADTIENTFYVQTTSAYAAVNYPPPTNLQCKIAYNPSGPNKVIFVFKDKNGTNFDPAKGQVINRAGSRPCWHDWVPYYPQVKTDTSIESAYPGGVPQLPIYQVSSYGTNFGEGESYYVVLGAYNNTGLNLEGIITPAFFITSGTYVVTMQFTDATKL